MICHHHNNIVVIADLIMFSLSWILIVCVLLRLDACHEQDDALKYLPEFNIEPSKYGRWQKYYDNIQHAYIEHYHHKTEQHGNGSCAVFTPLVDIEMNYYRDLFGGDNFITEEMVRAMAERAKHQHVVHYQIIDHQLYRSAKCLFPARCEGVQHFLKLIMADLPNLDMFVNVHDYPQVARFLPKERQFPIFSFSRLVSDYADLTYPAWAFWSGGPALDLYPRGIGRWDLMRQSLLKKAQQSPWQEKKKLAFFRGSRTSSQRDAIILLSRSRPDLVEAKYTKNQAWKSIADTLGEEPAATVSFEDHCDYRYLINAHGVAASFRLKHLFLCGSLVLDIQSDWIEFFYPALVPWLHFVPLQSDLSDAVDVLEFVNANDQLAERIADRGMRFIAEHVSMRSVQCYWHHLVHSYSSRLVSHRPSHHDTELIRV